jgi:iron(III) transport system substrate-binding protein
MLSVGVGLAACGASPTDTIKSGGGASASEALDSVYQAVKGLTGDARYQKLLELAKKESGPVGFYHSGDMTPEVKAFTAQTGIKVADFQATSERVAERVNNENKAGRQASDVVLGGASDMIALHGEGGFAPLDSPVSDTVTQNFKAADMVDPVAIMQLPSYNTNAVKPGDVPKTWDDYFTTFSKRKAIELTDWEWYATIVTKYFVEKKHMTEDAAIKLITEGMKGSSAVDGHTLVAQLLASGQYDFVPNLYAQYLPGLLSQGAALSNDGTSADLPPTVVTLQMGLTKGGKQPAGGLLLLEWMMSAKGQKVVADQGYIAPANTYQGQSLIEKYPYAIFDTVFSESAGFQDKWKKAFDTLLQAAGTKKVAKS